VTQIQAFETRKTKMQCQYTVYFKNQCSNLDPQTGNIKIPIFNCHVAIPKSCTISDVSQILNICMHYTFSFNFHVNV